MFAAALREMADYLEQHSSESAGAYEDGTPMPLLPGREKAQVGRGHANPDKKPRGGYPDAGWSPRTLFNM